MLPRALPSPSSATCLPPPSPRPSGVGTGPLADEARGVLEVLQAGKAPPQPDAANSGFERLDLLQVGRDFSLSASINSNTPLAPALLAGCRTEWPTNCVPPTLGRRLQGNGPLRFASDSWQLELCRQTGAIVGLSFGGSSSGGDVSTTGGGTLWGRVRARLQRSTSMLSAALGLPRWQQQQQQQQQQGASWASQEFPLALPVYRCVVSWWGGAGIEGGCLPGGARAVARDARAARCALTAAYAD